MRYARRAPRTHTCVILATWLATLAPAAAAEVDADGRVPDAAEPAPITEDEQEPPSEAPAPEEQAEDAGIAEEAEQDSARVPPRPAFLVAQDDAVDLALRCNCQAHPDEERCRAEHRERVAEAVADLLWVVDQRADRVPDELRAILVAVACGESGFRDHPDCGGRPGCNDHGTSAGMFQFKRDGALANLYEELHGEPLPAHDHMEAGLFYLERLLVGVEEKVPAACGRMRARRAWNVAAYRLGRGPVVEPARPAMRVCAPSPVVTGGEDEVCFTRPAKPAVQRCEPASKYARWSMKWYFEAPHAWTLVPAQMDSADSRL
ncbi:MAG: hypothetical protein ACQEXJ_17455 [Myxococcota bacterium]